MHIGLYDTPQGSPDPERVRYVLGRVRSEIYRRKADELSFLVERYVACAANVGTRFLSKLPVEDGEQIQEIEVEHVSLIAAEGYYVRIHANDRTYEIRETLTGIAAKLDAERFARVHRSFIVNPSYVLSVPTKDSPAFVKLAMAWKCLSVRTTAKEFEATIRRAIDWLRKHCTFLLSRQVVIAASPVAR